MSNWFEEMEQEEREYEQKLYEDKLATDIDRIQRAKTCIEDKYISRREKVEAVALLTLYRRIAEEHRWSEKEDERERAREILYELSRR